MGINKKDENTFKSLFPDGFNVWKWKINTARDGYDESINDVLSEIVSQISNSNFKNKEVQKFLVEAFESIINGERADHAFLLKGKVSGKKKKTFAQIEKNLEMATAVLSFRNSCPQPIWEECFEKVATIYKTSPANAKKAYNENKDYAITQLEFLKGNTPLDKP